jgi:hypothetical protein
MRGKGFLRGGISDILQPATAMNINFSASEVVIGLVE